MSPLYCVSFIVLFAKSSVFLALFWVVFHTLCPVLINGVVVLRLALFLVLH